MDASCCAISTDQTGMSNPETRGSRRNLELWFPKPLEEGLDRGLASKVGDIVGLGLQNIDT
jgi:hypothetical protein